MALVIAVYIKSMTTGTPFQKYMIRISDWEEGGGTGCRGYKTWGRGSFPQFFNLSNHKFHYLRFDEKSQV